MTKKKTLTLKNKEDIPSSLPNQPYWNMKHYTFLQIYMETIDEKEAAKAAGFDAKDLKAALADPKIRDAMEDAKNDFVEALKLTPKKGAAKFLAVYEKVEKRFDEGDSKVAGALANMAATFLKATGQLGGGDEKVTPKVSININLGGRETKVVADDRSLNVDLIDSVYDKKNDE
jgi:hypothetical protein